MPEAALAIWAEALTAAERLDERAPARTELLADATACYQRQLRAMGRAADTDSDSDTAPDTAPDTALDIATDTAPPTPTPLEPPSI